MGGEQVPPAVSLVALAKWEGLDAGSIPAKDTLNQNFIP